MAYSKSNGRHYRCYLCEELGRRPDECHHDVNRTAGCCWGGEHHRCTDVCTSGTYGIVPCACFCHTKDQDVQDAIASITETIEKRS